MTLTKRAASVLGYRVVPTVVLTVITYFILFLAFSVTDRLPNVPSPDAQGGLDLKEAYEDLRHIAAHPHPYNSHANDRVRKYLLSRLQTITQDYPYVHIADDLSSNGSWAGSLYGVYFEGTNLLVRIDGTDSSSPGSATGGVLFSAHYDSVSTAPGATDDGMGVATLLQLVKYFSKNRTRRTAVFNINNGEEDWLNGAHAFLEHPWSNLTEVFLNLEGAAAGGRPILFRATSTPAVRSFHNTKLVPHPHANVLSSDAFSRGLIRSGTDFSVYVGPGTRPPMDGLDLAFYKGRSRYHTKYDAVQHTLGGQKSLWSMMEVAKGVGIGLLDAPLQESETDTEKGPAVYFDLFKSVLLVFPLRKLLTFNIVALVVGPLLLIALAVYEQIVLRQTLPRDEGSSRAPVGRPLVGLIHTIWTHAKFWVAFAVAFGLLLLEILLYVVINPFVVYSYPHLILVSFLALAYLGLTFTLTFPSCLPFYHPKIDNLFKPHLEPPAQEQKRTIFFHLYFFTWVLLILATIGITHLDPGLGSGYLVSAWNVCAGVGASLTVVEAIVLSALHKSRPYAAGPAATYEELDGERAPHPATSNGSSPSDERTPLLRRVDDEVPGESSDAQLARRDLSEEEEEGGGVGTLATWWWIPQFLVSVPIPVALLGHVTAILLDAMPQTLADGASPWGVYLMAALTALLLVLPLSPFAYKLRPYRPLTLFVFIVFLLSNLYAWLAFPFTSQDPLKLYFQQRVELYPQAFGTSLGAPIVFRPNITTVLSGPKKYLRSSILPHLPSANGAGKEIKCDDDPAKRGLVKCEWNSGIERMPVPGSLSYANLPETNLSLPWADGEFIRFDVQRTSETSARIYLRGRNTRSCRIYFDSQPIHRYDILDPHNEDGVSRAENYASSGKGMQPGYEIPPTGVTEVRLWSRTWEKEFVVDVDWQGPASNGTVAEKSAGMEGRVACEWVEYESGLIDNGSLGPVDNAARDGPKIPALEEVLTFIPEWAVVSKATDGLVEAWAPVIHIPSLALAEFTQTPGNIQGYIPLLLLCRDNTRTLMPPGWQAPIFLPHGGLLSKAEISRKVDELSIGLADINHRIYQESLSLGRLVEQRVEISKEIKRLRCCCAPIRGLPNEVLCEIFSFCFPEDHDCVMSIDAFPLVLARVCKRWRDLVFSHPLLWTSIHIPMLPPPHRSDSLMYENSDESQPFCEELERKVESHLAFVRRWLSRSGSTHALSTTLSCPPSAWYDAEKYGFIPQAYLELLFVYGGRWRAIKVQSADHTMTDLLGRLATQSFVNLTKLELELAAPQFRRSSSDANLSWGGTANLLARPGIRALSLNCVLRGISRTKVSWGSLTRLVLAVGVSRTWPGHYIPDGAISVGETYVILAQSVNLVECKLVLSEKEGNVQPSGEDDWNPILLYNLVSLQVTDLGSKTIPKLLSSIRAPCLDRLEYYNTFRRPEPGVVAALIKNLSMWTTSTRHLALDTRYFEKNDLKKCLTAFKHIKSFADEPATFRFSRSPKFRKPLATANSLLALLSPDEKGTVNCPQLRTIILKNGKDVTDINVLNFVKDRLACGLQSEYSKCTKLRRVEAALGHTSPTDDRVVSKARESLERQLCLELKYAPEKKPPPKNPYSPWAGIARNGSEDT
ncbi:hypothetical protein NLJ89_g6460 [Agrocybe chaxingu]|uniref:Peptide hydrolase n=1 Tax=Agrocybe chaxingu TaxID=84603 RepID=A0A9W8K5H7_9AGAR|nr:hypothetical protein NLJ89_g6460 [Agrocybe chaxingu]